MNPESHALAAVLARRSAKRLDPEKVPTAEQIEQLLHAAVTVPDHGELRPYRFVLAQGDARARFGDALVESALERDPALADGLRAKLRSKAFAAPLQILIVFAPQVGMKIPLWEQRVTAACTGYAITLAASLQGLGAIWKSAPSLEGDALRRLLAMREGEELLGWVNLGVALEHPAPRAPVDIQRLAQRLGSAGLEPLS